MEGIGNGLVWLAIAGILIATVIFCCMKFGDRSDRHAFFANAHIGRYTPDEVFEHSSIMALGRAVDPEVALPKYFKYKEALLVPIRSQGKCASCWAFAVSDMMADRVSLYTGGAVRDNLSVQELVSCFRPADFSCARGGIPEVTYYYPMVYGLTTEAKFPYLQERNRVIEPCNAPDAVSSMDAFISFGGTSMAESYPQRIFLQPGTNRSLCHAPRGDADTIRKNIKNMKTEIFLNGPIVGTLMVYEDLYKYDAESVYTVSKGSKFKGGHAIEIFGWSDAGQNTDEAGFQGAYWLCKNSWGSRFPRNVGDKYGWFYVKMGVNEASIESRASACMPVYTDAMRRLHQDPKALRENIAYTSYTEYVNDPERQQFFAHLQKRRKQKK